MQWVPLCPSSSVLLPELLQPQGPLAEPGMHQCNLLSQGPCTCPPPPTTLFPHSALWLAASLSLSFGPLKTWDFGSGLVMLQSATLNSLYLGTRKVPLSHSLHCHVMACHGMVWGVLMAAQRPRRTQAPLLGFSRSQWQWEGTMARHTVLLQLHSDLAPVTIHWPKQVTRDRKEDHDMGLHSPGLPLS